MDGSVIDASLVVSQDAIDLDIASLRVSIMLAKLCCMAI